MELNEKQLNNFWRQIKKTKKCWIWTGYIDKDGYGILGLHKNTRAHRIAWMLQNGEIPKNMCVLHKCDNPPCVNPKHLWVGTHQENMQDMKLKCRFSIRNKLSKRNIFKIRKLKYNFNPINKYIAKIFNVDTSTINRIVNRKTWKHI